MRVVVDTPIWSLVLRRRRGDLSAHENELVTSWARLVEDNRIVLVGPVRQEVLSGIRDTSVFECLRDTLRGFEDEPLAPDDYEEAARCRNVCQSAGLAGSTVDCLLCAVTIRRNASLFTTDADFSRYARHLPLRLYLPGAKRR